MWLAHVDQVWSSIAAVAVAVVALGAAAVGE
jgi:hypothetical protein